MRLAQRPICRDESSLCVRKGRPELLCDERHEWVKKTQHPVEHVDEDAAGLCLRSRISAVCCSLPSLRENVTILFLDNSKHSSRMMHHADWLSRSRHFPQLTLQTYLGGLDVPVRKVGPCKVIQGTPCFAVVHLLHHGSNTVDCAMEMAQDPPVRQREALRRPPVSTSISKRECNVAL